MNLIEIGKRLSQASKEKITAAIAVLQDLVGEAGEPEAREALRALQEAAMSHDDIRQALRAALQGTAPSDQRWYWVRDVYDDWFVYDDEDRDVRGGPSTLYKRSYAIVDGVVTLGDPQEVVLVTTYEPVDASAAGLHEATDPSVGGGVERDTIPDADFAGKNRSFPIVTPQDAADAARSIGRAGADNYSAETLKANILKICRRKGAAFMAALPDAWTNTTESAEVEITGDLVPLVEKAARADGTIALKIIQPGWGSSGHYSAEVLKRDGPRVFTKGLHMFVDHPTAHEEAERPERSVNGLGAVLASDAVWQENGPAGPGLYADARPFAPFRERLEELAPHIGVSIRALGKATAGEAEGRKGPIIEAITAARSVDFVTSPGAGGRVLQLFEAARGRPTSPEEVMHVNEQEAQALREAQAALEAENARLREDNRRLAEGQMLREARDQVVAALGKVEMPDVTRARLTEALSRNPVVTDGKLDAAGLARRIDEAVTAELDYIASLGGSGRIRGMGDAAAGQDDAHRRVVEAYRLGFLREGKSPEDAQRLAEIAAS